MEREIQSEESVLESDVEIDSDENETEEILKEARNNEPDKNETPEQSARKALAELQKEQSDGDKSQGDSEASTNNVGNNEKQAEVITPEPVGNIAPPQRLTAKEKEIFNKLPKSFKPAVARMFKDHDALLTRTQQELQREIGNSRAIVEAVQPFASEFAERGMTLHAGLAALCAAQKKLTNPATSKDAYIALGRDLGIDFEELLTGTPSNNSNNLAIEQHPKFIALQNQVNAILSEKEQSQNSQEAQAIAQVRTEFESVQNEINPVTKQYRYPELHDEDFLRRTEPLVSAFLGSIEGITPAQALKKAWSALTGKPVSNELNQTRLVANNGNHTANRAVSAAVSVRGKTSQSLNPQRSEIAVGKNETPEQSARIALEELLRG